MANRNQNVETPIDFIKAVESYFPIKFKYDLADDRHNKKTPLFFGEDDDSLSIDWPIDDWCWLNPTFFNLTKWINKCKEQKDRGCKIITIWPLSGDKNQITTWTNTDVYIIHGRVWPEVRGCMLCKWCLNNDKIISGLSWDKKELKLLWK
jgi:hypothetical protein